MADNTTVTAGAGTTIATDDAGGAHYQKMKLVDGTADSTTVVAVGEGVKANGIRIALPTDAAVSLPVSGLTAHDAADAGNPLKIGAKAISATPTAVAANDRTNLHADLYGQLLVNTTPINLWSSYEDETGATTNDALISAPGAGLCLYLTDLVVTNDSTADITFKLVEDTAGTPVQKTGVMKIPLDGMLVIQFKTPLKMTANKNLGYTTTGTSNFSVLMSGYTAP